MQSILDQCFPTPVLKPCPPPRLIPLIGLFVCWGLDWETLFQITLIKLYYLPLPEIVILIRENYCYFCCHIQHKPDLTIQQDNKALLRAHLTVCHHHCSHNHCTFLIQEGSNGWLPSSVHRTYNIVIFCFVKLRVKYEMKKYR